MNTKVPRLSSDTENMKKGGAVKIFILSLLLPITGIANSNPICSKGEMTVLANQTYRKATIYFNCVNSILQTAGVKTKIGEEFFVTYSYLNIQNMYCKNKSDEIVKTFDRITSTFIEDFLHESLVNPNVSSAEYKMDKYKITRFHNKCFNLASNEFMKQEIRKSKQGRLPASVGRGKNL